MKIVTLITVLTFCAGAIFTFIDIGTDFSLAYEYWNNSHVVRGRLGHTSTSNGLNNVDNFTFGVLTTVSIALGGLIQFLVAAFLLLRDDNRLKWLPKPTQILLLLSSPILMAPIVVNLFGVIFVVRNADDDQIQDSILR